METISKIKISKFELNSISESFENIYLSDKEGGVFIIDKEKKKIKKKINLD